MKDTIITAKRKRTELITLVVCFILANLCNVYAIVKFDTQWKELATSLGFVVIATAIFYGIWTALRLIAYFLFSVFGKKKRSVR